MVHNVQSSQVKHCHTNIWLRPQPWLSCLFIVCQMGCFQSSKMLFLLSSCQRMRTWLVGGLEHQFYSWLVGGLVAINFIFPLINRVSIIIPIDELIFFRGVAQPPTRWFIHGQTRGIFARFGSWIVQQATGKAKAELPFFFTNPNAKKM